VGDGHRYTEAEVEELISKLSTPEIARLMAIATSLLKKWKLKVTKEEAKDLLNEAIVKSSNLPTKPRRGIELSAVIVVEMNTICRRMINRRSFARAKEDGEAVHNLYSQEVSAEEGLIAKELEELQEQLRGELLDFFKPEPVLLSALEQRLDRVPWKTIQYKSGIDKDTFDNQVRKKLQRRLASFYLLCRKKNL
jgi:hypothetical protein